VHQRGFGAGSAASNRVPRQRISTSTGNRRDVKEMRSPHEAAAPMVWQRSNTHGALLSSIAHTTLRCDGVRQWIGRTLALLGTRDVDSPIHDSTLRRNRHGHEAHCEVGGHDVARIVIADGVEHVDA
jgi:hypothetical protein